MVYACRLKWLSQRGSRRCTAIELRKVWLRLDGRMGNTRDPSAGIRRHAKLANAKVRKGSVRLRKWRCYVAPVS
jgi:hypothetical protein